jgi:hypothetical protein
LPEVIPGLGMRGGEALSSYPCWEERAGESSYKRGERERTTETVPRAGAWGSGALASSPPVEKVDLWSAKPSSPIPVGRRGLEIRRTREERGRGQQRRSFLPEGRKEGRKEGVGVGRDVLSRPLTE